MHIISVETKAGKGKTNEDRCGVRENSNSVLVVLADGMGSTDCAKEAADIAVNTIIEEFDVANPDDSLYGVVFQANEKVTDVSLERGCTMGCAIAALFSNHDNIWYVALGNVRIYVQDGEKRTCITEDDVYVASNGRTFLTRSISGRDLDGKVEVKTMSLSGVSKIIMATDGYYNNDTEDDSTVVTISL